MTKVNLILPKMEWIEPDHPFPPLGILYLGAALREEGIAVSLMDGNILSDDEYNTQLENLDGDIVGISSTFFHTEEIKRILPIAQEEGRLTVVGGPGVHSLLDPKSFMTETGVDFLLDSESEYSLVELVRSFEGQGELEDIGGLHRIEDDQLLINTNRTPVDVNDYPIPARDLVDMSEYRKWGETTGMIVSRGCPYTCSFCDLFVSGRRMRYRNIDNVLDEFEELQEQYGISDVFIFDDLFTIKLKYLVEFEDKKKDRENNMTWGSNARINLVKDSFCETIVGSGGNRLFFGVESGSERILQFYNKQITPDQIRFAFSKCKEYGIGPNAYIMIGHPEETWEDVERTADLIAEIKPADMDLSVVTPIPGTELFNATLNQIDLEKLRMIETRQVDTVYKDLKFDVQAGLRLIREAYESTKTLGEV